MCGKNYILGRHDLKAKRMHFNSKINKTNTHAPALIVRRQNSKTKTLNEVEPFIHFSINYSMCAQL